MHGVQGMAPAGDLPPEAFKRAMLAYAEAHAYRRLVARTLGEVKALLDEYGDQAYVSYSGGKDSLVLLHITARVKPDIKVFHWDHGPWLMPREVEDEILRIVRQVAPSAKLRVESSRGLWVEEARWDYKRWYRAFWATVSRLARQGWRTALLGLRAEEGVKRRLRTSEPCRVTRIQVECYPLRGWSWRDVWAYIFEHNLPYPSVYNQRCPLLGWDKCRLVTFYDEEFKHLGNNIDGVLHPFWKHQQTRHSGASK